MHPIESQQVPAETGLLPEVQPPERPRGLITWLKRIGILGFLFFLGKGIVWLFVIWGGARMIGCE